MLTTNLLLELFSIRAGLFKFSSDRLSLPDAQLLIDRIVCSRAVSLCFALFFVFCFCFFILP